MGAYSVAQVKAQLSALLEAVERGEEVVITKRGKPVARIRRESVASGTIDWKKIDALRTRMQQLNPNKPRKSSVSRLRDQARY